ncbi:hypothetical protein [Massilia horti]|uniref:Uncharacterized protein n=1 Tax=Massilia horti TaxID=2562153 RepID=A0A4Y9SPP6_9BURK|nr:hypothetical protein [Massilia horti]TFW28660.1 hypothetical protein E4O92_20635 [Massilia horti]
MNYSIFRFEAVVDFIEVRIHTTTRNQGWKIKGALALHGISYVEPVQPDAAGWSSHFRIKLYDLRTHAALQSKLASIESECPFASPPVVTMIEVAFDGYLKDPAAPTNHNHLAALAARMAYQLAAPVSPNSRIYRDGKGGPTALPRTLEAIERKMVEGWNVGFGDKTADQYQHGYLKTTDHNKKPIPVEIHRARFEIRLAGAALPDQDIDSWKSFKFESLAPYISFRKADPTADQMQQAIIAGYADRASHRKAIPRKDSSNTRAHIMPADTELNQIVKRQLQHLTRRWSYVRKSAKISTKK